MEANTTIQFFTNVLDIEEDIDLDDESIPTKQTSTIINKCYKKNQLHLQIQFNHS
jgi:hypothetical protein